MKGHGAREAEVYQMKCYHQKNKVSSREHISILGANLGLWLVLREPWIAVHAIVMSVDACTVSLVLPINRRQSPAMAFYSQETDSGFRWIRQLFKRLQQYLLSVILVSRIGNLFHSERRVLELVSGWTRVAKGAPAFSIISRSSQLLHKITFKTNPRDVWQFEIQTYDAHYLGREPLVPFIGEESLFQLIAFHLFYTPEAADLYVRLRTSPNWKALPMHTNAAVEQDQKVATSPKETDERIDDLLPELEEQQNEETDERIDDLLPELEEQRTEGNAQVTCFNSSDSILQSDSPSVSFLSLREISNRLQIDTALWAAASNTILHDSPTCRPSSIQHVVKDREAYLHMSRDELILENTRVFPHNSSANVSNNETAKVYKSDSDSSDLTGAETTPSTTSNETSEADESSFPMLNNKHANAHYELRGRETRLLESIPSSAGGHFEQNEGEASENSVDHDFGDTIVTPFSLLSSAVSREEILAHIANVCHVKTSQVIDIMPCTPLQEGLIALTEKRPGDYITRNVFEIGQNIDVDRLKEAWDRVAAIAPILRTRIVSLPVLGSHSLVQVILDECVSWQANFVSEYDEQIVDKQCFMGLNTPLTRYTIQESSTSSACYMIWEIHHALYDGWSLPLILREVENAYFHQPSLGLKSMAIFIKYLSDQDKSAEKRYWRQYFDKTCGTHFPATNPNYYPQPDDEILLSISDLAWGSSDYTSATILKAAWAVTVANSAGSDEALFGLTVTGRQAPLPGIELIAGPTIATVPLRIPIAWEASFKQLLDLVQGQAAEMILFEQTGLQNISRVSDDAAVGSKFQSLLVVQPTDDKGSDDRPFLNEVVDGKSKSNTDTFPIVLECQLSSTGVDMRIAFDSTVIARSHIDFIVQNFRHILIQMSDNMHGEQIVRTIKGEDWDLHQAWTWNEKVPDSVDECVHNLISKRVAEDARSSAINAWDGNFTYGEMDDLSTELGLCVTEKKMKGKIVPLLFEKSKWMPIAALSVMKAGGCCLAIDPNQPQARLRTIIEQVDAELVLSSVKNEILARQLGFQTILVVGLSEPRAMPGSSLPEVASSDMLYVNFTSGSTGVPKGAIVSHGNFCSAIMHQQKLLDFSNISRVFDFSSYAFDAWWYTSLFCFASGGCLCIPSQMERDNDLSGCLERYEVNLVDLTPSVARIVDRKTLSRLSTLILGGEAVSCEDAQLASHPTKIINVYGPAECTPTATLAKLMPNDITIGHGAGLCTWVVDTDTLLPTRIGAVGELWLEGPLVGQGYLQDREKTQSAFVENPSWLTTGIPQRFGRAKIPGRQGRLYRTGDLVRYRQDGTLVFVGRKDTQVKIRGQRVELGDIEQQILSSLPTNLCFNVIAETIQVKGSNSAILVAFITPQDRKESLVLSEKTHNTAVEQAKGELIRRMVMSVPSYLIPTAFIPILKLPLTTNGKTDRKALRVLAESTYLEYRQKEETGDSALGEAMSDIENILQQIWMSVLNLTAQEASVNKSFTRIGGDSITAMQIVSQSRLHNIIFTVSDLLQASTIKALAARCSIASDQPPAPVQQEEEENAADVFGLSPIQQMFFDKYPEGLNHWNQSFLLELSQQVTASLIRGAMNALVYQHAMLRCRFLKDAVTGIWMQRVVDKKDPQSFLFAEHYIEEHDNTSGIAQMRQESLDLRHGPVFACDFFHMSEGRQMLLLSAHHAVVDLVSWRIIWGDIENFISHGKLLSSPQTTFHQWCHRQAKVGANLSPLSVLPFSIPEPDLEFWALNQSENTFSDCEAQEAQLSKEISIALFAGSNDALRTEPIDIIIGALAHSFLSTFPEREVPVIWIEGHGRELSDDMFLDVADTVGWFTTLHPLPLPLTLTSSITDAIRFAKDRRRQIPNKGQPYFSCRYYSQSGRESFQGHDVSELTLNFTGQFQQLEREEGLFKRSGGLGESQSGFTEISPVAQRFTMIEINAEVEEGSLLVTFQFHKRMKHQHRLKVWSELFSQTLESVVRELCHSTPTFTLTDLPLLPLSYSGLDHILREWIPNAGISLSNIMDIYPCLPLQEGILLSAQKETASYATISVWRCIPTTTTAVLSVSKLGDAWQAVVRRHTILRSLFTMHPEGDGFIQIVLNEIKPRVAYLDTTSESPDSVLACLPKPIFVQGEPEHAFTICRSTATGEVACRLDANHSLIDATSMTCVLQDLSSAYKHVIVTPAAPFRDMVQYVNSTSTKQRIASWAKLLRGVQPCEFPVSVSRGGRSVEEAFGTITIPAATIEGVAEFCRSVDITRSVFIQVAWALVLAYFTGKREVCFGYLANGRDAPVAGIETMVGPLANLLISRINLESPPKAVLQSTFQTSIKHLTIQHTSLAEIQHHLGLSERLFNTTLSIRGSDKIQKSLDQPISFEPVTGEDPHEFDLGLSVSIDGNETEIMIEYQEPNITRQTAHDIQLVLISAIQYLSSINVSKDGDKDYQVESSPHEGLYDEFIKHFIGVDESSAIEFWSGQFANIEGSHFPSVGSDSCPSADKNMVIDLPSIKLAGREDGLSAETLIAASWAILASRMTDSSEGLFGMAIQEKTAVVPLRIPIKSNISIDEYLQGVQCQSRNIARFGRLNIQRIKLISEQAALGCDFQTVLRVVDERTAYETEVQDNCALAIICKIDHAGHARLCLYFASSVLEEQKMVRISRQIKHILSQLINSSIRMNTISSIKLASSEDIDEIWGWNRTLPEAVEARVHDIITQTACERPSSQAICAWDGNLTYQELEELSDSLAADLVSRGVGPGTCVPLLFEKSLWMPVATLAIIKAGAAAVATDVSTQPKERLREIIQQVKAELCVSSVENESLAIELGVDVVVVGRDRISSTTADSKLLPVVSPSDPIYIVFTSGSSGTPKGVIVCHQNICSALNYQRCTLGFREDSKVLDFSSYAFDVWWSNLFNTLTAGACLCIPSSEERQNDLSGALKRYHITIADITPSIARHLTGLETVSTLILGGEVVLASDRNLANQNAMVCNTYGPSECTPTATILNMSSVDTISLGRGFGVCTWVVEPDNGNQLAPIGASGELWLEGPLVGNGYMNDEVKTALAFIQDPEWLLRGSSSGQYPGRHGKLYRTGDIVQYKEDGSLLFVGRKDNQIKLRGQRIELEEVEHHVKLSLQNIDRELNFVRPSIIVAAEVIQLAGTETQLLAAFISLGHAENEHDVEVSHATMGIRKRLATTLPPYMVPSIFIPLQNIPRLSSGKIDRRQLRMIGSKLTNKHIRELDQVRGEERRPPCTDTQRLVQRLWADIIKVDPESISVDDSFFRIGGDSIGAMRLVASARQNGLHSLTVRDIFRYPVLHELAAHIQD